MKLLNTRQLAEMLGISITRAREICRKGDLPSVIIAGRYYLDLGDTTNHRLSKKRSYRNIWHYEHKLRNDHMRDEHLASLREENEVLREKVEQMENKLKNIKNNFWDIVR